MYRNPQLPLGRKHKVSINDRLRRAWLRKQAWMLKLHKAAMAGYDVFIPPQIQ